MIAVSAAVTHARPSSMLRAYCSVRRCSACRAKAAAAAAGSSEGAANALAFFFRQRGTDQQDASLTECALLEQGQCLAYAEISAMAAFRHQRRFERVEQIATGRQVIRQRHQRVRAAGVDDDRGLRIAACLQQVEQLAPGLFQSGGR